MSAETRKAIKARSSRFNANSCSPLSGRPVIAFTVVVSAITRYLNIAVRASERARYSDGSRSRGIKSAAGKRERNDAREEEEAIG